jgi:hypothetical protein
MPAAGSTTVNCIHAEDPVSAGRIRRRQLLYRVTTGVLALVMLLAVLDGFDVLDVYGVDDAHVRATAGGVELDVRYGTVSRPALATPFDIVITRRGGFDAPIDVAVSSAYLAMWDENGLDPGPTSETTDGENVIWTFEPPPGDVLAISFDARIEPAAQEGERGRVAVLAGDGSEMVAVTFETVLRP